ncbi:MAG TPA: PKD domain-containing protein [Chryseosolibacter sp.]
MRLKTYVLIFFSLFLTGNAWAQCTSSDIMEPGFQFLTSSRGCAPFQVRIETLYLASTPGTTYYVNWGDGSPEEVYTQGPLPATGVELTHIYPNSPVDCGYDVTIDAENACNPRGSVVQVVTQVVVWTNDIVEINPAEFRVCQGFAASLNFTDNSDWNCHPRATRENNASRWLQWIYNTGSAANVIPGVQVNGVNAPPNYLDPAANRNPQYPVNAPGQTSLPIAVPVTAPADIGKFWQITMKNWNQCNAYDNNLANGPQNPADVVNGDNPPQITTARIVIVESPQPSFLTRLGNAAGAIQSVFCLGDDIFLDNQTPAIAGAAFGYRWEFYNNNTGAGAPAAVRTSAEPTFAFNTTGQKLIRLIVRDNNAAGGCEATFDRVITISPSLVAQISVTDIAGNPITGDFCQENNSPFTNFEVRFSDSSIGTPSASTEWRWEFYDETNALIFSAPTGSGFSASPLGPFDRTFTTPGQYRVRLRIRDNLTTCETEDEEIIRVLRKPVAEFTFNRVCQGTATTFTDQSTLNAVGTEQIILREWDFDYDGVTFAKDPAFDNETSFTRAFAAAGAHRVALRVTTDQGGCSSLIEHTVMVDALPTASFAPDRLSGCSVLQVNFTNNSVAGQPVAIKEYRWEINNGSGFQLDSVQRPTDPGFSDAFTKDFSNYGTTNLDYEVRLRVVTVNDCETISSPVTITVYPGPQSGFVSLNYSPFNSNCTPVSVNFSADATTQSQNPSEYLWTVSDGTTVITETSTGTTPSFTYNFVNATQSIQDFEITLRATLPTGCFGDSTRTIRVNPVPSSQFTIDTLDWQCESVMLRMEATQKGLQQYEWTLRSNGVVLFSSTTAGDRFDYDINRSTTVDQNISIELRTTNFANCQSAVTTRTLSLPSTVNINANFTASPMVQQIPSRIVTITNNTTAGPWTYVWNFGDGTTGNSSAASFTHTYPQEGIYPIELTVTNGDCMKSHAVTISILPSPPVLEFEYDPSSGCLPLTVNFTNRSQYADPTTYAWEFGAGQGTSTAINPSYTYYEPGIYSVTLSAKNSAGESAQVTKQLIITVYDKPNAQFNVKPSQIQFPGGRLYTDNRSFGATSYSWDFGDGGTSTEFEPTHEYVSEGVFDIQLVAYNSAGCADTMKLAAGVQTIRSGQMLIPNAFSPATGDSGSSNGKNDTFKPILVGVTDFQMLVFNRWGQLLFETRDPEIGWDGYYQGRLCQQDVYVYKINAKYSNGERVNKVGDIHLIR